MNRSHGWLKNSRLPSGVSDQIITGAESAIVRNRCSLRSRASPGLLPLGDVAEYQHHAFERPVPAANRRAAVVDGNILAGTRDQHGMIGQAHHLALAQHPADGALHFAARLLVDNVENPVERQAASFGLGVPGQTLRDRIHHAHRALRVGGDDGVPNAIERGAEQVAGGGRGGCRASCARRRGSARMRRRPRTPPAGSPRPGSASG